jgi:hypothetical protein
MHDDQGGRMGWLVVLGLFWMVQLAYFLSPIDFIPDFIPVFGFADDILGLLVSFLVTGVSVWRAIPDGPRAISAGDVYEPLTDDELELL